MTALPDKKPGIVEELQELVDQGIQVDRTRLKKDMCEQFIDPREWYRESVVNAFDADATVCWISGREDKETITITIADNGHGMDRKGILDFNMLYRSVKSSTLNSAVGQFGVGKLSVAAIKGQKHFVMLTSTGTETWRMKANCLLDDDLILLEKLDETLPRGTKLEITFDKKISLARELLKAEKVLRTYLKYKDIAICISSDGLDSCRWLQPHGWDSKEIHAQTDPYSRRYLLDLDSMKFDVVLSIGATSHEVYKQRVLVTNHYDLLFWGQEKSMEIPFLTIRVDSDDFEVPIGRHCLSNESELLKLTKKIWADLLPQYIDEMIRSYQRGFPQNDSHLYSKVEEMMCALMLCKGAPENPWNRFPIFNIKNGERQSMIELQEHLVEKGKLYLEDEVTPGADYSVFDAPVLAQKQPKGGEELIETIFDDYLIKLGTYNIIFERPVGQNTDLDPLEKEFQQYLGFHPLITEMNFLKTQGDNNSGFFGFSSESQEELERLAGVFRESREAIKSLEEINWRANYLVHQDGRSPCTSQLFLYSNKTVVLNLNHEQVKKFVALTRTSPALAGHWALAMCLTSGEKILPELSAQVREDLILMDAIAKCGTKKIPELLQKEAEVDHANRAIQEFIRKSRGDSAWMD